MCPRTASTAYVTQAGLKLRALLSQPHTIYSCAPSCPETAIGYCLVFNAHSAAHKQMYFIT